MVPTTSFFRHILFRHEPIPTHELTHLEGRLLRNTTIIITGHHMSAFTPIVSIPEAHLPCYHPHHTDLSLVPLCILLITTADVGIMLARARLPMLLTPARLRCR